MRRAKPLLGTFVEIGISNSASKLGDKLVSSALEQGFYSIQTVQDLLSFHSRSSELTQLNTQPGEWVQLSPMTIRVLRLARGLMVRTNHAFNCTCGGLLVKNGRLPNPHDHNSAAAYILEGSAADLEITATHAKLNRPIFITLDGIAKGFAVDQAIRALKHNNLTGGWVNAGGDLRVFGDASLAVKLRTDSHFTQAITIANSALASSQTRVTNDSRFPAQIVGGTAEDCGLISIKAKRAWKADALTKVAICAREPERSAWLKQFQAQLVSSAELP